MRAFVAGAAFALVTSLGTLAFADGPAPAEPERAAKPAPCDYGPRNAISTEPLALAARGVGFAYERLLGPPTFSVSVLGGGRSAALGDYSSVTVSGGLEGRAWARINNRGCGAIAMSGLYVGLRLTAAYTEVTDRVMDERVGSSYAFSSLIGLGYRLVAWRVLEVTPSIYAGLRSDVDPNGGLGTSARGAVALGLTVGWMF